MERLEATQFILAIWNCTYSKYEYKKMLRINVSYIWSGEKKDFDHAKKLLF